MRSRKSQCMFFHFEKGNRGNGRQEQRQKTSEEGAVASAHDFEVA
jgi:hypothetical protein